ncbi:mannitol dehydrogenase family protein [Sinomicrobium sp.]
MYPQLNNKTLALCPDTIRRMEKPIPEQTSAILHFGVGAFHRSHQAFYLQRLIDKNPELYAKWKITGACIMPGDKTFVEHFRNQDFLYSLKSYSPDGQEEVELISVIDTVLYGPENPMQIINKIASPETLVVSFTITEGGYMIDDNGRFQIEHPDILWDLDKENAPKTVFGYLARGLSIRKEQGGEAITLLSCDNVQENGKLLKQALLAFLEQFDAELVAYVLRGIAFPNTMVDRITPVTTADNRKEFASAFHYQDHCLVVCEAFHQWIIEDTGNSDFPPLQEAGAIVVPDVSPYEMMKLRILNGGHSLLGLVGKGMGIDYIHTAVSSELLSELFDLYTEKEAIPSLEIIDEIDFYRYASTVKSRFGNSLIKDSTDRIISYSSAKIPRFVLPVLQYNLNAGKSPDIAIFIIATWWFYLYQQVESNKADEIEDVLQDRWKFVFSQEKDIAIVEFLNTDIVFGSLGKDKKLKSQVTYWINLILSVGMYEAAKCAIQIKYSN